MKREINNNTIIVGDFNTPFTPMDRSTKWKINNNTRIVGNFNIPLTPMDRSTKQGNNKETHTLNDTLDWLDLIDIYRTFHPKTVNFTFFGGAHRTFS